MKAGLAAAVFAARSDRARRRRPAGHARDQRHGGRRERRLCRRRASGDASGGSRRRERDFVDHPGAAERRPHLRRPPRRLLVRADDARPHRARQHAVSRRQRDRGMAEVLAAIRARARAGARRAHRPRCRSCRRARAARRINVNAHRRRPAVDGIQTPCVADRCRAVFDRRFLIEEGFDGARKRRSSSCWSACAGRRAGRSTTSCAI